MQATLEAYRAHYFPQLIRAFCALYLFMQCFTIPGCFFLTVMLGSLLPHVPATVVATALATVGCTLNFFLSRYILADVMMHFLPAQVLRFQQAVTDQSPHNLFSYMLFIRVVAIVPSWMVNLASPLANVPFATFVSTTIIGFQPQVCPVSSSQPWQRRLPSAGGVGAQERPWCSCAGPDSDGEVCCVVRSLPRGSAGHAHSEGGAAVTTSAVCVQMFILISGGRTLSRIHSWKDIYTWHSLLTLAACAVLSGLPIALRAVHPPTAGRLETSV